MLVADLNGDGRPDVVVGGTGGVEVLDDQAGGTLGPAIPLPESLTYPTVAVADLNGDGRPDLIVAGIDPAKNNATYLDVQLSQGAGAFAAPTSYQLGQGGYSAPLLDVADLNGDARPDVIVGGAVLLNNGDGTLAVSPTGVHDRDCRPGRCRPERRRGPGRRFRRPRRFQRF